MEIVETIGSPEAIAEVQRELDAWTVSGESKNCKGYRQLCMKKARLTRRRGKVARNRLMDVAVKAKVAEARARQAVADFTQTVEAADAGPLVAALVKLASTHLLDRLRERISGPPCKACGRLGSDRKAEEQLLMLATTVFRAQKDREPVRKSSRVIEVAEWPSESAKS